MRHPAVATAAVIGVPDSVRGEIVKAYVVPAPGFIPSEDLKRELQTFVRTAWRRTSTRARSSFDALPLTTTGKIRRGELPPT